MPGKVTLVYNEPEPSRYDATGEVKAVVGVLDAVQAVDEALCQLGYQVARLPLSLPEEDAAEKLKHMEADLVFNLFEGFCGFPETESLVPETLSRLGIPFTGCQARVIRLALDKNAVKIRLRAAGIVTPDSQLLTPRNIKSFRLEYPCIVKPCSEDASHGVTENSVVADFLALEKQVRLVSESYGGRALVEKFIDGREFNATIMGNRYYSVLPISEIVYSLPVGLPRVLTFAAKWEDDTPYYDGTKAVCPAEITEEERQRISETALAAFKLLGKWLQHRRIRSNLGAQQVVRYHFGQKIKPEQRNLRQNPSFAWNPCSQYMIEGRNPIRRYQQQVIAHRIQIPHFAPPDQGNTGHLTLPQRRQIHAPFLPANFGHSARLRLNSKTVSRFAKYHVRATSLHPPSHRTL